MARYAIAGRALISIGGEEAEHFLQNLITLDLGQLDAGEIRAAALLTPQGKIAYPFLIGRTDDGFFLETESGRADELFTRLNLYRLRAKVTVGKPEDARVAMSVDDHDGFKDSRFPADSGVQRLYGEAAEGADDETAEISLLRIVHGVPEADIDYTVGDAFAFDALLDQLGGLSVRKGCFVGQEVVSRMHHRGTARRRVVQVQGKSALPPSGTPLMAAEKPVGQLGTVADERGLAMVRVDRVANALSQDIPIFAGQVPVEISVPERFTFSLVAADSDTADDA